MKIRDLFSQSPVSGLTFCSWVCHESPWCNHRPRLVRTGTVNMGIGGIKHRTLSPREGFGVSWQIKAKLCWMILFFPFRLKRFLKRNCPSLKYSFVLFVFTFHADYCLFSFLSFVILKRILLYFAGFFILKFTMLLGFPPKPVDVSNRDASISSLGTEKPLKSLVCLNQIWIRIMKFCWVARISRI